MGKRNFSLLTNLAIDVLALVVVDWLFDGIKIDTWQAVIGAAILGKVGGEMIITDPFVERMFHPGKITEYSVQLIGIVGVIVAGKLWAKWKAANAAGERVKPLADENAS